MHRLAAVAALILHMFFVAFTLIGGFIVWLAPWILLPHIAAALWGGRIAITQASCPLSVIENWGREGTGRPRLDERGFIAHYFEGRIYPAGWSRRVNVMVAGLIVGSWLALTAR